MLALRHQTRLIDTQKKVEILSYIAINLFGIGMWIYA